MQLASSAASLGNGETGTAHVTHMTVLVAILLQFEHENDDNVIVFHNQYF
jgi:hypothetical protein